MNLIMNRSIVHIFFIMNISFHSYANKTKFHMKNFALSLAFVMRFKATRKCPIQKFLNSFPFLLYFQAEIKDAHEFLGAMGLDVQEHVRRVEVNFSDEEIKEYENKFQKVNKSKRRCLNSFDLRNMLKEMGEEVSDKQLHELIAEVDTNRNSCVDLDEFVQVCVLSLDSRGKVSTSTTGKYFSKAFTSIFKLEHKKTAPKESIAR